ncbi:MAG TPA: hypothetical protein P5328_02685 [Candidatus Paceibacterota bacterium]|nr:hypothetical protein [Candidatus Paceibacterota bacterium]HRZ34347.1 hypothetical protein [Candidatus Paceibacterota bacterium]
MKKIIKIVLDLLFPPSETLRELESLSSGEIFARCAKWEKNFPQCGNGPRLNLKSILKYKDPLVKEMLWQIKFRGQRKYAEICGEFLYKRIIEEISSGGPGACLGARSGTRSNNMPRRILIPVPIHQKRRKERGFNQCEWLCEKIMELDAGRFLQYEPNLIHRVIYKQKQSWSDKKERIKNLEGVFAVTDRRKIIKREIIVLDDVYTTGATLNALGEIILQCEPANIRYFTVAH